MLHSEKMPIAEVNRINPYIQSGKYLHTRECPFIEEHSIETSSGFERIEDALEQQVTLCSYCIGENVVPKPAKVIRTNTARINKLRDMCHMLGFQSDLHGELFFIRTDAATWYFDIQKYTYLFHYNHVFANQRKSGLNNFHKQPRIFTSHEEMIRYINKHDKAVIAGKSLRMVK